MSYFTLVVYTDGDELLDAQVVKTEAAGEMAEEIRILRKCTQDTTDGAVTLRAYSIPRLVKVSTFREDL